MTVSADGANVYVATGFDRRMDEPGAAGAFEASGVAVFARNRSSGALRQLGGRAGCISETGTNGACRDGTGLWGASSVALSPDGRFAYAPGFFASAVTVFGRAQPARRGGR